jgi:hypothetical protein
MPAAPTLLERTSTIWMLPVETPERDSCLRLHTAKHGTEPRTGTECLLHRLQSLRLEARPPTGANSCRSMTIATSFRRRPPGCPRSTSTASEPCQTPGHNKPARRPDSERLRADARKTPLQGGTRVFRELLFGGWETGARGSRAAHQSAHARGSVIGRAIFVGLNVRVTIGRDVRVVFLLMFGSSGISMGRGDGTGLARANSPDVRFGHPALRSLEGNLASPSWLRSISYAARLARAQDRAW